MTRGSRRTALRCMAAAGAATLLLGCPGAPARPPAPVPAKAAVERDGRREPPRAAVPTPVLAVPVSRVRAAGDGQLHVVAGSSAPVGGGSVTRYLVEVEGRIGVDPAQFTAAAERTLADARSWTAGQGRRLQRVDSGPVDFRLVLASPSMADRLCAPLRTGGRFSCHQDGRAVINAMRWLSGATTYDGRLEDYRHYVVNHEVGHALGEGHVGCPGRGQPAPVMMQQTKGVGACAAQPWPYPQR